MVRSIYVGLLVLFISGCEEAKTTLETNIPVTQGAYLKFDSIGLEDGDVLRFDGRLVRYDLLRNEKGAFDRFTIDSHRELMSLEVDIFWPLARKGYVRKVRRESAERYVVNYVLKGGATIIADYRESDGQGSKTRVILTRKTLDND